ncbi:MAG: DEAD/DEAH box helicase family protein [Sedimentisphaerales bacterium]|nr:DEAD/DEAH box helicase family protein [Sedimentisphaerales bacterium]
MSRPQGIAFWSIVEAQSILYAGAILLYDCVKMDSWPVEIKFNKTWRTYQARVLCELADHLDDNRLHIIAAPGSGKTVLGLEVARRLDRPTLIFSPTLAIRDQWVERLVGLFTEAGSGTLDWVSKNIKRPGFFTVSTYQGLHSAYTGVPEEEDQDDEEGRRPDGEDPGISRRGLKGRRDLISKLRRIGIETLILDEAHHLRNEWWKCLIDIKEQLGNPTIVALTATPPFDVSPFEWERYIELCGPVDSEICVPELVLERNLCPHQDYVYISEPLQSERARIKEFRRQVDEFLRRLCVDEQFISALENHRCMNRASEYVEEILSDPAFYSSMAFFLNHVKGRPPKKLLHIIGFPAGKCPGLNLEWAETLLAGCLYSHSGTFTGCEEVFERISRDLKRIGAIERRQLGLRSTGRIARLLVASASKLESIKNIVRIESETLGPDLRMVILTDFIRREDFPKNANDVQPLKRLGVVPIFEVIRRDTPGDVKLGILSGSLVVIPWEAKALLEEIAGSMAIDLNDIRYSELGHDSSFCTVTISGSERQKIVTLITRLFSRGGVTVLVGTKSLLGEGWDAPSINCLILASFVGSYMLSNQMRGRAIRTQPSNPEKSANIWHLVCVEHGRDQPSEDMEMLTRRFKAFEGVSLQQPVIENGIERLGLGRPPFAAEKIEQINARMSRMATDRARLMAEWEQALASGLGGRMAEEVTSPFFNLPRSFVFTNTILAVLWQGLFWGLFIFSQLMRTAERNAGRMGIRGFLLLLGIAFGLAAIVALPKCLKALWLFLKHAPIAWSMKQIGRALVRALAGTELIKTNVRKLKVITTSHPAGLVSCSLEGAETYERCLFLDSMQEILGPISNPRYLMVRKTPLLRWVRKDYHVVPQSLGRNKESAEYFAKMWAKYVGPTELVYTRSVKGRRILLKARGRAMSASFQRRSERTRAWK